MAQALAALALQRLDFRQDHRNIFLLLLEHCAARRQHLKEFDQLGTLAFGRFVEIQQLAYFGKRQAEALAAKDELDPYALPLGVDPAPAVAPRGKQALVLVIADRASGQREFSREVGNAVADGIGT